MAEKLIRALGGMGIRRGADAIMDKLNVPQGLTRDVIVGGITGGPKGAAMPVLTHMGEGLMGALRGGREAGDQNTYNPDTDATAFKKGGKVGKGKSASNRADGCAQRGKTRGRMI